MVVQALIFAYGVPQLLQKNGVPFRWPELLIPCMLVCGMNSAAYMAEIIRGGLQAVEKGQMEAAMSLGMTHSQAMRLVIIPQAASQGHDPRLHPRKRLGLPSGRLTGGHRGDGPLDVSHDLHGTPSEVHGSGTHRGHAPRHRTQGGEIRPEVGITGLDLGPERAGERRPHAKRRRPAESEGGYRIAQIVQDPTVPDLVQRGEQALVYQPDPRPTITRILLPPDRTRQVGNLDLRVHTVPTVQELRYATCSGVSSYSMGILRATSKSR